MGSNRFYITLVVNCLLIFLSAFLCFYFIQVRQQPHTAMGIAVLAFFLTIRLIHHVNRANRILGNFLSHMHEEDPSISYSVHYVEKNFKGLNEALDKLIHEFKENRIELEVQANYLETILDNIATGILCFDKEKKIRIMNRAAKELLDSGPISYLHELDSLHKGLGNKILHMHPDEQLTESLKKRGEAIYLNINSSQIKLKQENIYIIALNDITHQMEEQEILSWKRLIRVINHEIMNSMTPIITLAMAIRKKLSAEVLTDLKVKSISEAREDAIQSAAIIEERSQGLVQFIERYKKLTSLPPVSPERFSAVKLFNKVNQLFRTEFQEKGIRLNWPEDCNIDLVGDRQMLEQVLINLIKNSVEATKHKETPEIGLFCALEGDRHVRLSVNDNGEGIPKEKLEQVFIPFYTTRDEGSGIGLSLCRQIIRSHNGKMHIESEPGTGTRVLIILMRAL